MRGGTRRGLSRGFLLVLLLAAGCETAPEIPDKVFRTPDPPLPFSASEALKKFEAEAGDAYRLGEGDGLTVQVWDRPDLSGPQTIGPDGVVTIPVAGPLKLSGLTREEAAKTVHDALARFYDGISVTIRIDQYVANRVVVLGHVRNPGVQRYESVPSLLEAISRAGVIADDPLQPLLTHCAILRGRDRMAWIDLRSLLESGNLSLNLRLKPNDVILVPDRREQPVYVLGQVPKPGAVRWFPGMTFLDALSLAGGLTRDSMPYNVFLVRPSQNYRTTVSLSDLTEPAAGANLALEQGDIIYAPSNVLADVGYLFEKLNPFGWVFLATGVKTGSR